MPLRQLDRGVKCFENPTRGQLKALIENSLYQHMRGYAHGDTVLVWDAHTANHLDILHLSGMEGGGARFTVALDRAVLLKENDWPGEFVVGEDDPFHTVSETPDWITPRLARVFRSWTISETR